MVAVFAGRGADLLEKGIRHLRMVAKEVKQDVVTTCGFRDFEQLAAPWETGYFMRRDGLVEAS
jgi:hypothetical protein